MSFLFFKSYQELVTICLNKIISSKSSPQSKPLRPSYSFHPLFNLENLKQTVLMPLLPMFFTLFCPCFSPSYCCFQCKLFPSYGNSFFLPSRFTSLLQQSWVSLLQLSLRLPCFLLVSVSFRLPFLSLSPLPPLRAPLCASLKSAAACQ